MSKIFIKNKQEAQIKSHLYPNSVAENAKINKQYKNIANKITEDNIKYFFTLTKIPHPSGFLDKIIEYLQGEFTNLGFVPAIDKLSGSLYVDIPASANCEESPKVIIQSHMDLVPSVADSDSCIDLAIQGIDAFYDSETGEIKSVDNNTNIGADDGVGMSLLLSIAKNSTSFEHPEMRLLFTKDEEIGLVGASKLSSNVLDAEYLINYDWNRVGEIIVSSAGAHVANISKEFNTEDLDSTDRVINIRDLKGGHTAETVSNPRKSKLMPLSFF